MKPAVTGARRVVVVSAGKDRGPVAGGLAIVADGIPKRLVGALPVGTAGRARRR